MGTAILILVLLAAVLVIASGFWVAMVLAMAIFPRQTPPPPRDTKSPTDAAAQV